LPVVQIKNKAGNYVVPTFETVTTAAAEAINETPEDLRVSITDAAGTNAYPISSYVYVLIYKKQRDANTGKSLVEFLLWGINEGEKHAEDLFYSPLPQEIVKRATTKINSVTTIDGRPLRETTNL
jgi:phosphate transport system substrate-binding protein